MSGTANDLADRLEFAVALAAEAGDADARQALGFGNLGEGHLTRKAVAGVDGENPSFARSPRQRKDDRRY